MPVAPPQPYQNWTVAVAEGRVSPAAGVGVGLGPDAAAAEVAVDAALDAVDAGLLLAAALEVADLEPVAAVSVTVVLPAAEADADCPVLAPDWAVPLPAPQAASMATANGVKAATRRT